MGAGASFTLFKAGSSSRMKKPSRKIQPEPPSLHLGPVFAVPLAVLRETGQLVCGIPWVLRDMVELLDEHALQQKGLFRLSGSVVKTSQLKARCDRGEALEVSAGMDFQSVASLLKLFLRELPLAVIPGPQHTDMVRCFRECTDELTLNHTLKEKLNSLPEDNYNILSYLCNFLLRVASHSQTNHMTVENLATVFGPCLFHVPQGPSMLEEQSLCNAMVRHLLKNHSFLMSKGLDSPSPPPVLQALVTPEEKAFDHIPVWPCACEGSAEAQQPDIDEKDQPGTAETQELNTAEILMPNTAQTLEISTSETIVPNTAQTLEINTSETLVPNTAQTLEINTSETLVPNTSQTLEISTSETIVPNTAQTLEINTSETLVPNTAQTLEINTSETIVPNTAQTLEINTSETLVPNTAQTLEINTSETLVPNTAQTLEINTSETLVPNTAQTLEINTSETLVPNTAHTQVLTTSETRVLNIAQTVEISTSETLLPNIARTLEINTSETLVPNTPDTLVPNTAQTLEINTSETLVLNTADTQVLTTSETLVPNTPDTLVPNTAQTLEINTSETLVPNTPDTQVLTTSETLVPNTAHMQVLNTADTQVPNTPDTQVLDTPETFVLNTPETFVPNTSETLVPNTPEMLLPDIAETKLVGTAEKWLLGTTESLLPGTAETQLLGTPEKLLLGTPETLLPGTAHPVSTPFQLTRDEPNRLKPSAGTVPEGNDSVALSDARLHSERPAVEDQERSGPDRILQPRKRTSSSGSISAHQEGHSQDMDVRAEQNGDLQGNADAGLNGDLLRPGAPHTDRVEHISREEREMLQASDKGSLLELQGPEEEVCPPTGALRQDPGHTANQTGSQETGPDPVPRALAPDGEDSEGQGPPGPSRLLLHITDSGSPLPSPRCSSLSRSQRFHSDPETAPSPPCSQPFIKARPIGRTQIPEGSADTLSISLLTKHIQALKRKIRRFEEQFERERNYRPSHNDKTINPEVFQLTSDLAKSRKQLRDLKLKQSVEQMRPQRMEEHADIRRCSSDLQGEPEQSQKPSLEDTLEALLKRLREKRQALGLPDNMKEMTQKQMALEKITLQKCLLYFESLHGRPGTRHERSLMKPLYDRYRTVKQLLCTTSDITTIAEEGSSDDDGAQHGSLLSCRVVRLQCLDESPGLQEDSDSTFVSPLDEVKAVRQPAVTVSNLHEASRMELLQSLRETRAEKKRLHKGLREFQEQFCRQMGRTAQKDDRIPMAEEYQEYKNLKAKLRLLEALLSKQGAPKII